MNIATHIDDDTNNITTGTVDSKGSIICIGTNHDDVPVIIKFDNYFNEICRYTYTGLWYHINKVTTDIDDNIYVVGYCTDENGVDSPWIDKFSPQLEHFAVSVQPMRGRFNYIVIDQHNDDVICIGETSGVGERLAGLLALSKREMNGYIMHSFDDDDYDTSFRLVNININDIIIIGTKRNNGIGHQILRRFHRHRFESTNINLIEDVSISLGSYNATTFNTDDEFITVGHILRNDDGKMYPQVTAFDVVGDTVALTTGQMFTVLPPIEDQTDDIISMATFTSVRANRDGTYIFGGSIRKIKIGEPDRYDVVISLSKNAFTADEKVIVSIGEAIINDTVICDYGLIVFGNGCEEEADTNRGFIGVYTPDFML